MAETLDPRRVADVRLALTPGVGPLLRRRLLEAFGDAHSVLCQPAAELRRVPGVGPSLASRIEGATEAIDAELELRCAADAGVAVLTPADDAYPAPLREIHDPPGLLFVRGGVTPADQLAVALVGTRRPSRYGLQQAGALARGLATAGVTVVSGLARGIDTAAHRGALEAGGRTLAVLANGLLRPYPPENAPLLESVAQQGAAISEAPLMAPPLPGAFPQRNRIISGLTLATVVVEAADRSGALITARHAMEQGREVLAVPGPIDSPLSRGCHRLIQDGAKLVGSVDDILEELGPLVTELPRDGGVMRSAAELGLNDAEHAVLQAIETTPTSIEDVVERSGAAVHRVLATVSVLEVRGLVRRVSGVLVSRV